MLLRRGLPMLDYTVYTLDELLNIALDAHDNPLAKTLAEKMEGCNEDARKEIAKLKLIVTDFEDKLFKAKMGLEEVKDAVVELIQEQAT
jgi:hypothetical protein